MGNILSNSNKPSNAFYLYSQGKICDYSWHFKYSGLAVVEMEQEREREREQEQVQSDDSEFFWLIPAIFTNGDQFIESLFDEELDLIYRKYDLEASYHGSFKTVNLVLAYKLSSESSFHWVDYSQIKELNLTVDKNIQSFFC